MSKRFAVRRSGIHGKGVFALVDLPAGVDLLPYGGDVLDWDVAQQRYDDAGIENGHTFFFDIGDGRVIDGGSHGNSARWINHGCNPNCEAVFETDTRLMIRTRRRIRAGDELLIDYRLEIDDPDDALTLYACACGARNCRHTMASLASD
ncbi:SET domain-containing protein [Jatrophihabitans sp. YIM 134969]